MKKTLVLIAVAAVVAGAVVTGAHGTGPVPLSIVMDGTLTGPTSAAGTWQATGLVEASGTYAQEFRFAGHSIHDVKTLVSPQGTLVLKVQATVRRRARRHGDVPRGLVAGRRGDRRVRRAARGRPAGRRQRELRQPRHGQIHIRHDGSGHFE